MRRFVIFKIPEGVSYAGFNCRVITSAGEMLDDVKAVRMGHTEIDAGGTYDDLTARVFAMGSGPLTLTRLKRDDEGHHHMDRETGEIATYEDTYMPGEYDVVRFDPDEGNL